MRKPLSILAALCFVGCLAGIASAQTQVTISCADFARNPDGSWSPVKPFTLGGITMGPGVKFTPGVLFNGLDFASALNQHCQLLQQYNKRCPAGKFSAGFFIAADSTANTAYHKVYSCVHICPQYCVRAMAKKRGGFRLDLGEPLASELTRFCERNFRKKTEVVRQALRDFLRRSRKGASANNR